MSVARSLFVPLTLCLSLTAPPSHLMAQQRAPVPDEAKLDSAKKAAGELYGERFRQARTPADRTALAKEMIEAADKLQNGEPGQYVLLQIAANIGAGAGDAPTALQAIEKLSEHFDIPEANLTAETLLTAAHNATRASQYEAIGEAVLSVADILADADEYELLLRLCETVRSAAQEKRQFALAKSLTAKVEEIEKRQAAFNRYRDALAVLDNRPTDPAANLAAGRYLCFTKGAWDHGVPMLALGNDLKLKAAARLDLRGADSADEQAAIGDAWWEAAESGPGDKRDTLRLRASFWYRQALDSLGGLTRLKVQQRLDQLGGETVKPLASESMPVGEIHCFEGQNYGIFSPDGQQVLCSHRDNSLRLWDAQTRREVRRFVGHTARPRVVCFVPPKGDRIVSAADDGTIRIWDTGTAREVNVITTGSRPQSIRPQAVVAYKGTALLWCTEDRRVRVTELETGRDLRNLEIRHGDDTVYIVAFSRDGQWALSGGFQSTSRLWHVPTGRSADLKGDSQAYGGALSPDGQFALTGGWDKVLILWKFPQGVEVARFLGHGGHVYTAAFSPDGRLVLSGDGAGEVRLWDTQTRQQLHCYRDHTKSITRLCFSPDGRYGLSSGDDDTVRLFSLAR